MHAFGPAWVLLQMDPRWNQPIPPSEVPTVTHFVLGQRNLGSLGMVNVLIPITAEAQNTIEPDDLQPIELTGLLSPRPPTVQPLFGEPLLQVQFLPSPRPIGDGAASSDQPPVADPTPYADPTPQLLQGMVGTDQPEEEPPQVVVEQNLATTAPAVNSNILQLLARSQRRASRLTPRSQQSDTTDGSHNAHENPQEEPMAEPLAAI